MTKTLRIKKNDIIKVISGRDRGKQGKVTQVFPRSGLIVAEGVNLRFRHLRTTPGRGKSGSRVQYAAPLPVSKVMVVCPHCSQPARVRMMKDAEGNNIRSCHRCRQSLTAV